MWMRAAIRGQQAARVENIRPRWGRSEGHLVCYKHLAPLEPGTSTVPFYQRHDCLALTDDGWGIAL
jgi:hypothetical protein